MLRVISEQAKAEYASCNQINWVRQPLRLNRWRASEAAALSLTGCHFLKSCTVVIGKTRMIALKWRHMELKRLISHFTYRIEPKPGGGFIAHASDPAVAPL